MTHVAQLSPSESMTQLLAGFMTSQALYAVATLDVLTHLDEGPLPLPELARRTGTDPESLWRVIRALAPHGVFTTDGDRVASTPVGATLSRSHPESVLDVARFWMETSYLPFSELTHTVRTGEAAATRYLGQPYVDWVTSDPDRAALLGRAMAAVASGLRRDFFTGYDLPPGEVVADVGGADGSVLVELLRAAPERRGIVLDLPGVVPQARGTMAREGLADRVEVRAGDFFAEVPTADVYVLSTVLHDWDDATARRIVANVASAAAPDAHLLVIESLVPDGDGADMSKTSDLLMMGIAGGRERSADELGALLDDGGFGVERVTRSSGPYSIVQARLR
jgi:hypothetical protein